jgi:hypothetical protein
MKQEISINFTKEDLKDMLSKHLISKDKDRIADIIAQHISQSSIAFEQTFKAFLGIFPTLKYKKGNVVYVNFSYLPTWRIDRDLTLKLKGVRDELIPVKIIEADVYAPEPYKIEFACVKSGAKEPAIESYSLHERYINHKEEDILDFIEQIDEIEEKES